MTSKELNRDIKRLGAELYRMSFEDSKVYWAYIENAAKKEFMRLFYADTAFEFMNLNSVKLMLRLNIKHRFVPLHTFGLSIDETKLI